MKIEHMNISTLNTAEYNPRLQLTPDMPEFERLKQSITEFGNVEPIIWNKRTGNVVGGNQRLTVLKNLGETETDVVVVDMPLEEEKLLNVALNKVKGDWDYDKLPELLKEFNVEDVKLSGFSAQELAILCADVNAAIEDIDDDDVFYSEQEFTHEEQDKPQGVSYIEKERERDFIPKRPEDIMINTSSSTVPVVAQTQAESADIPAPLPEVENYLISLIFDKTERAVEWLNSHGYGKQYKQGTHSTMVRIK